MTQDSDNEQLFFEIDKTVSELLKLFSSLNNVQINAVPYEGSWTAAQVLRHVVLSTNGIAQALRMPSKQTDRNPGERIDELKTTFLDFANKMQSPDAIVPESGPYNRETSIKELNTCFEHFKENTKQINLKELVVGLPLGDITKLEMLHFVLYHTQRHQHQMKKICAALLTGSSNISELN